MSMRMLSCSNRCLLACICVCLSVFIRINACEKGMYIKVVWEWIEEDEDGLIDFLT